MAGPWEKYQSTEGAKPWEKYGENPAIRQDNSSRLGSYINQTLANPESTTLGRFASLPTRLILGDALMQPIAATAVRQGGMGTSTGLSPWFGGDQPVSFTPEVQAGDVLKLASLGIPMGAEAVPATRGVLTQLPKWIYAGAPAAMYGAGQAMTQDASPGGVALGGAIGLAGGAALGKAADWLENTTTRDINRIVEPKFTKAIRPSVVGKGTLSQVENYNAKAVDAVKSIVENKPNLALVDKFGEETTGRLPSSLREFTQAIDQTKKKIFVGFNELQQKAGQTESVRLQSAAKELMDVATDPNIVMFDPAVADYAEKLAYSMDKRGAMSLQEAQDAVAQLNAKLDDYYNNPNPHDTTQMSINAMVANNLRKELDDAVDRAAVVNAGEPGYQELRNKYASLRSIENDVNKRSIIDARKNVKGLIDLSDIWTARDVIAGVASGHPATVAGGAGMKMMAAYQKWRNDPNTMIKQMFNRAERVMPPGGWSGNLPKELPAEGGFLGRDWSSEAGSVNVSGMNAPKKSIVEIDFPGASDRAALAVENKKAITSPNMAYRGMTETEFNNTVGAGKGLKSRNDYSLPQEGTSLANDFDTAQDYVTYGRDDPRKTGKPVYVVEVPSSGLEKNRQGYLYAREEIPKSQINRIWKIYGDGDSLVAERMPAVVSLTSNKSLKLPSSLPTSP